MAQNPAGQIARTPESVLIEIGKCGIVYRQGDSAGRCFEVLSGTVRTCRFSIDGHRQLIGFHFKGDVFGMDSIRYSATAEAVTNVKLRRLNTISYRASDERAVNIDEKATLLEKALDSANQYIFLLGHRTATERVAAFLLNIFNHNAGRREIELSMSRADIGDHLGLTLHTVSRSFSKLTRQGAIQQFGRHRVLVKNLQRLRWFACEPDLSARGSGSKAVTDATAICTANGDGDDLLFRPKNGADDAQ